jgi:hypothetical protein
MGRIRATGKIAGTMRSPELPRSRKFPRYLADPRTTGRSGTPALTASRHGGGAVQVAACRAASNGARSKMNRL